MVPRVLRISLVVALLAAAACSKPAATTCSGNDVRLVEAGKLTIAADYAFPPFAFRSPKGDLVGSEVEVAKAVAAELELEPTFVNRGAGALVTGLLAHRHDLAVSGLRSTPELEDQACPSVPFLDADLGVLVSVADKATEEVSDLAGRTVAVLDESVAEDWTLEELGRSTIASLPTTDDLLTALRQGEAAAVVADLPFARFAQKESSEFRVAAEIETGAGYVLVAADDNGPLVAGVNGALERLRTDGTLAKIERKWFGG